MPIYSSTLKTFIAFSPHLKRRLNTFWLIMTLQLHYYIISCTRKEKQIAGCSVSHTLRSAGGRHAWWLLLRLVLVHFRESQVLSSQAQRGLFYREKTWHLDVYVLKMMTCGGLLARGTRSLWSIHTHAVLLKPMRLKLKRTTMKHELFLIFNSVHLTPKNDKVTSHYDPPFSHCQWIHCCKNIDYSCFNSEKNMQYIVCATIFKGNSFYTFDISDTVSGFWYTMFVCMLH